MIFICRIRGLIVEKSRKHIFVGSRLREARENRNLTQDELALILGIGQSQMNKYENNKSEPSPEVIGRMARELEVTADWLLGLVNDRKVHLQEKTLSPTERKLLSAFRRGDLRGLMRIAAEDEQPKDQLEIAGTEPIVDG